MGVFDSRDQAENAVAELRKSGYDTNEISIVAKNQQEKQGAGDNQGDNTMGMDMGSLSSGTTTRWRSRRSCRFGYGCWCTGYTGSWAYYRSWSYRRALSGAATGGIAGGV